MVRRRDVGEIHADLLQPGGLQRLRRELHIDRLGRFLAGIERAVDPNQDGDTKDHVDVINLSLGGPGNSDDPLSCAVNAASSTGDFSI